jgi:hypothetical protein
MIQRVEGKEDKRNKGKKKTQREKVRRAKKHTFYANPLLPQKEGGNNRKMEETKQKREHTPSQDCFEQC